MYIYIYIHPYIYVYIYIHSTEPLGINMRSCRIVTISRRNLNFGELPKQKDTLCQTNMEPDMGSFTDYCPL